MFRVSWSVGVLLLVCMNRLSQNTFTKPHVNGSIIDITEYVIITYFGLNITPRTKFCGFLDKWQSYDDIFASLQYLISANKLQTKCYRL